MPQLKYIQIDDVFQPFMGDWLDVSDKFNRSMKDICSDIKKAGFEPAIWLAPFIASEKSNLLKKHPDYFVKDTEGNPLCSSNVNLKGGEMHRGICSMRLILMLESIFMM